MKRNLLTLSLLFTLSGCSDEMPDLAGKYLLNRHCDDETFLDHVLTLDSEYLPNVGYTYSVTFPKGSSILPDGHPLRSYRSSTETRGIVAKFYRPSSHTGSNGFETNLTLQHLPNGDLLLQQWNIKSWHHTTRKMSEHQLNTLNHLAQYTGQSVNQDGENVSGLCLRTQADV